MLYGIGPDDDREKTGCILRRHRQRARVGRYGFKDWTGRSIRASWRMARTGASGGRTPFPDYHREASTLGDPKVEWLLRDTGNDGM